MRVLCNPSGKHDIDLARVRLWEVMGKNEQAKKMLLAMAGKHLGMADEMLCNPSGKHDHRSVTGKTLASHGLK